MSILALLLIITLGVVAFRVWPGKTTAPATVKGASGEPTIALRRSVAVLGFQNLSGQPSKGWLSTAISEMLTTELAAGEQLRVVSGEEVARAKVGLALPAETDVSSGILMRLRKSLHVDYVVIGSFYDIGNSGNVRLDLRLEEASSGKLAAAVAASSTEEIFRGWSRALVRNCA